MKAYTVIADGQTVAGTTGPAAAQLWRTTAVTLPVVAAVALALALAVGLVVAGATLAAIAAFTLVALAAHAVLPPRAAARASVAAVAVGALALALAPVLATRTVASVTNGIALAIVVLLAGLLGRATRTTLGSLAALRDAALVDRRNAKDHSREATARLLDLGASVDEILW